MLPIFEEHDALIVAAARGILHRISSESPERLAGADAGDAYRIGRIAEACDRAADAITNALISAEVRAGDPHAKRARRGPTADAPPPVPA